MRYFKLMLCLSLFVLPMFGCTHTHYVKLSYTAETPKDRPGAGQEVYVKKALDNRPITNLLGRQKDAGHTHLVVLENGLDFSGIVTSGVSDSLSAYGYLVKNADGVIPAGSKELRTTIKEFWTDYSRSFFTMDTNSNVELDFELRVQGTDRVLWKKNITTTAKASSAWGYSLYEESLDGAFKNAMEDFQHEITTPDFRNAVSSQTQTTEGDGK